MTHGRARRRARSTLADVVKDYGGSAAAAHAALRRARGASGVAILGFDKTAAEVLVNLMTGSSLPRHGRGARVRPRDGRHSPTATTGSARCADSGCSASAPCSSSSSPWSRTWRFRTRSRWIRCPPTARGAVRALGDEVGLVRDAAGAASARAGRRSICSACGWGARWRSVRDCCSRSIRRRRSSGPTPMRFARDMSRIVSRRGMAAVYITADRAFAQQAAGAKL